MELDMKELGEAVKSVSTGFEAFKEANDARLAEIEGKGQADPLLDEKLDKINEDMQKAQDRLDAFQLSQKRQSRIVTDGNGEVIDLDAKAANWAPRPAHKSGNVVISRDVILYKVIGTFHRDNLTVSISIIKNIVRYRCVRRIIDRFTSTDTCLDIFLAVGAILVGITVDVVGGNIP